MTDGGEPTARAEYAQRMVTRSSSARNRLLPVQVPYRAHIRRVCHGRVLDVGCGIGRNLAHLGERSVGVDHNPVSVEIARNHGHTAYNSAEFAPSPGARLGGYDCVLMAHVLEHMSHEHGRALLTSYLVYLRPGGRVVLICPQRRGYGSDPTHVQFLDLAALTRLCHRVGLLVRRQYSFPFPRSLGRVFTHNEFVVLAEKARAIRS